MRMLDSLLTRLNESLVIDSHLCSRIRHKNSGCSACMDVCRSDALSITRAGGKVNIDWEKCTSCGECISACKSSVFNMKLVDRSRMISTLKSSISESGDAVFACMSKWGDSTAGVPALPFLDRKIFIKAALMGADRIVMRTGDCMSCIHTGCRSAVQKEIDITAAIFKAAGEEINFIYEPLETHKNVSGRKRIAKDSPMMNRREFFGFLGARTKKSVGQVVYSLSENDANRKKTVLTADKYNIKRSYVQDLRQLGGPELLEKLRYERIMPSVSIDTSKCRQCGVCARMCASGVYTPEYETIKGKKKIVSVKVNQEHCIGCGVCSFVCFSKALSVSE